MIEETAQLREELRAVQEENLLLHESMADVILAAEDKGWRSIAQQTNQDFTPESRRALLDACRAMALANPLIKRGLIVRTGYIWGQGVQVQARSANEQAAQDVNAVVQDFWDDNKKTFSGDTAHERLEHGLGTDGNIYLICYTHPQTGSVRVRTGLPEQVVDIVTNPEDRDDHWYYVREIPMEVAEKGASGAPRSRHQVKKVVHPAVGYYPRSRPRSYKGMPVKWDAPIVHVSVNLLPGWRFGVPDVYASLAWARAYKDFLVDWASLTRSLSKYAWQATGATTSRAQKMAQEIKRNSTPPAGTPDISATDATQAGQTVTSTPDMKLEPISKSGATIDSDSGRPLAGMAAAGLGLPVTVLLSDPGITGARAVAETLDPPTVLEMGMRRLTWQAKMTELVHYVISQAVLAPRGPLKGTVIRNEWDELSTAVFGGVETTLDWEWPEMVKVDPIKLVRAVNEGHETGMLPPLITMRLLLNALGVKDVDEVLRDYMDEDGEFLDPRVNAGQAAVDQFKAGQASAEQGGFR